MPPLISLTEEHPSLQSPSLNFVEWLTAHPVFVFLSCLTLVLALFTWATYLIAPDCLFAVFNALKNHPFKRSPQEILLDKLAHYKTLPPNPEALAKIFRESISLRYGIEAEKKTAEELLAQERNYEFEALYKLDTLRFSGAQKIEEPPFIAIIEKSLSTLPKEER